MDRRDAIRKLLLTSIGLGVSRYVTINDESAVIRHIPKIEHILAAVGDLTLANYFDDTVNSLKHQGVSDPYAYVIRDITSAFKDVDLTVANLEGTFTDATKHVAKSFNFKGNPEYIKILKDLKIRAVNLANNHFMDYYSKGALDTIKLLDENDIVYCGGGKDIFDASAPRFIDLGLIRLGFLGYAMVGKDSKASKTFPGTNPYIKDVAKTDISKAKDLCDILVISCHWGREREYAPSMEQVDAAKAFLDSGADIVLGHHPHVLQDVREYSDKLVFYSLGNFIFGGNSGPSDRNSMIAKIRLGANNILDYSTLKIFTHTDDMVKPKLL